MAAAALFASLAGLAPASAAPDAPRPFYGVVAQRYLSLDDVLRMSEGNVGSLRFALGWGAVDSGALPADYDWSAFDGVVASAAHEGIDLLPVVYGVPRWVSAVEDCDARPERCDKTPPHTTVGLAAWRAFLITATRRYGPDGVFWAEHPELPERPLRVWQIWNEENDPGFFKPRPDVNRYAELLGVASHAIRGQDPGAEIVLGGMCCHPLHGRHGGIRVTEYLRRLYAIPGIEDEFDGVAVHPYANRFRGVRKQVVNVAGLVHDRVGDEDASIWVTELGWSSSRAEHPLNRGPRGQARRLEHSFRWFTRERERLGIRAVLWYSWRDVRKEERVCVWCARSGLFPVDSLERPKRAWKAFVGFTGGS